MKLNDKGETILDKELFLKDTQYGISYHEMIQETRKINCGIAYAYNPSYIIGETKQYEIFDGIWIAHHNISLNTQEVYLQESQDFIQINYCISGRCELHYKNKEVFCVGADDFALTLLKSAQYKHSFPLGRYNGISIVTTQESLDRYLQIFFPGTRISSQKLFEKIEKHTGYIVLTQNSEIIKVMREIVVFQQEFWREKAILKFAELILLLMHNDMELQTNKRYYTKQTVHTVKHIKQIVTSNLEAYTSIQEISLKFHISAKLFSNCFKDIYGETYYSFIKEYRIKKAADMLLHEELTIGTIALAVGYQNPSKFSKAFSDVMGVTPIRYRKDNFLTVLE